MVASGLGMIQRGVYLEHHKDCDVTNKLLYHHEHYLYSTPVSVTLSEEGDCYGIIFWNTQNARGAANDIDAIWNKTKWGYWKEMTSIDHIRS